LNGISQCFTSKIIKAVLCELFVPEENNEELVCATFFLLKKHRFFDYYIYSWNIKFYNQPTDRFFSVPEHPDWL
jgi:hypothetical protein